MSSEAELIEQRRENLEALKKLGVEVYPRRFERRQTVSELVGAYGQQNREELEAAYLYLIAYPPRP